MMHRTSSNALRFLAFLLFVGCFTAAALAQPSQCAGRWQVSLETPGGALSFELEIADQGPQAGLTPAEIINGPERIPVTMRRQPTGRWELSFDYYDSKIEFDATENKLTGVWTKTRGPHNMASLPCSAVRLYEHEYADPADFLGRWQVKFADSHDPAVGVFEKFSNRNDVLGTFLTTTGDYRYLYGYLSQGSLQLSCFDGAHAFLFHAALTADGKLEGEFWSGNWHHETWTAERAPDAKLPDGFMQTVVTENADLAGLAFPDTHGEPQSLADPQLRGRVTLIEIFGSWCPNCHDEAAFLKELRGKYARQGLEVLGLAFELTGNFERDARQVRRYCERFDIDYPILIAGTSDKEKASLALPIIDRVRSYPTTLFIDARGTIRAVYSGFSGPATGEAHLELRRRFEALIEKLLAE